MDGIDRGRLRVAVLVTLVVAVAGITVATGFVFANDEPTGEEVYEDVREKYNTADSVSADTVVTVESENGTETFDASIAATDDGQMRLNISDDGQYVTLGATEETAWIHDPRTGLSAVLADDGENTASASLRAGSDEPEAVASIPLDDVNPDDTVGEVLAAVDEDELPAELQDALEELPENQTLGDLVNSGELEEVIDADSVSASGETAGEGEPPEQWEEFNGSWDLNESALEDTIGAFEDGELPEEWNESLDDLPEEWNKSEWNETLDELPEEWNESEWNETLDELLEEWNGSERPGSLDELYEEFPEEWNTSEWPGSLDELHGESDSLMSEFNGSAENRTIELVGTTTVNGQEANELLITSTEHEYETRLWAAVDSNELLRMEVSSPELTVTVEVIETRFDVSPADSTFEAPGTTELARLEVTTTDVGSEFGTNAPIQVAVPDDPWEFERGTTVSSELSVDIGPSLDDQSVTLLAEYVADNQSVLVTQSDTAADLEMADTVSIGDLDVVLTETESGTAATWTDGETTTTVVSELSESELRSVVESLTYEDTAG